MLRAGVAPRWLLPTELPAPARLAGLARRAQRLGPGGSGVAHEPVPRALHDVLPLVAIAESLREPLSGAIAALTQSGFSRAVIWLPESRPGAAAIAQELRAVAAQLGATVAERGADAAGTLSFELAADLEESTSTGAGLRVLLLEDPGFLAGDAREWPALTRTLLVLPWLAGLDYGPGSRSCEFAEAYRARYRRPPGVAAARLHAALELLVARGQAPTLTVDPGPGSVTGRLAWSESGVRTTDHVSFLHYDASGAATLYLPETVAGVCAGLARRMAQLPLRVAARPW
jgi:hypothetical protein